MELAFNGAGSSFNSLLIQFSAEKSNVIEFPQSDDSHIDDDKVLDVKLDSSVVGRNVDWKNALVVLYEFRVLLDVDGVVLYSNAMVNTHHGRGTIATFVRCKTWSPLDKNYRELTRVVVCRTA
jgi:hypothetical protein